MQPFETQRSGRLHGLDGLRGLAALSVAFSHSMAVYKIDGNYMIWAAPLKEQSAGALAIRIVEGILDAQAAVVLFFVLSGYVLSRSIRSASLDERFYFRYMIRRLFRILPAMWCAILVAFALLKSLTAIPDPELFSAWYLGIFSDRSLVHLVGNLILAQSSVLGVTWTMSIELIGSMLIPVFCLINRQYSPVGRICFGVAIWLVGMKVGSDASYMPAFFFGSYLAATPIKITHPRLAVTTALVLVCIISLSSTARDLNILLYSILTASIVAAIAEHPQTFNVLERTPIRQLGEISYSFYLFHTSVLLALTVVTFAWLSDMSAIKSNFALFIGSAVITFIVSTWSYRFIEIPSINRGREVL